MGFMQKDIEMLKSSADLKSAHAANRNKSTGRTKSPTDKYYISPSSVLDEYTKKIQKRVGFSKAGWASCAMQLKKIISGSQTRGIPKWVTEDMVGYGEVIDNTNNLENPHVSMTNKIPWASSVCPPIEVVQAQMVVGQKMKNQMAQILKKRNKVIVEL